MLSPVAAPPHNPFYMQYVTGLAMHSVIFTVPPCVPYSWRGLNRWTSNRNQLDFILIGHDWWPLKAECHTSHIYGIQYTLDCTYVWSNEVWRPLLPIMKLLLEGKKKTWLYSWLFCRFFFLNQNAIVHQRTQSTLHLMYILITVHVVFFRCSTGDLCSSCSISHEKQMCFHYYWTDKGWRCLVFAKFVMQSPSAPQLFGSTKRHWTPTI